MMKFLNDVSFIENDQKKMDPTNLQRVCFFDLRNTAASRESGKDQKNHDRKHPSIVFHDVYYFSNKIMIKENRGGDRENPSTGSFLVERDYF